jgi:leucyl aminopeptidase
MMSRTARLGATTELDGVGVVAVVARAIDDEFTIDGSVPHEIGTLTVSRSLSSEWAKRQGLTDTVGSTALLRSYGDVDLAFVSGGSTGTNSLDEWRRIAAAVVRLAGDSNAALLLPIDDVTDSRAVGQALSEGALLASYDFREFGDESTTEFVIVPVGSLPTIDFHDALESGVANGVAVGESMNWAKFLIDTPAGVLTPKDLAKRAVRVLAKLPHVDIASWSEPKIEDEKLGGLLGVSAGSAQAPRLLYATYDPEPQSELTHVALVGKGVTFDSGGLSLKSGDGMMTMKTDMTGAATVLAVLSAASRVGLRVKLTVITPLTENLPGPRATKPGDVLTIRNGMTIEVLNTDAEGRLILADGLSLAVEASPDAIIDVATLTGAQRVALGDEVGALFSTSDDLASQLLAASDVSGEAMCRLPLFDNYDSHVTSDVADMKNIGKPQNAGAVVAALILRKFTADVPWAHFDIAGPGRCDAPRAYYTKGATAFSGRTILEYLRQLSEDAPDASDTGTLHSV